MRFIRKITQGGEESIVDGHGRLSHIICSYRIPGNLGFSNLLAPLSRGLKDEICIIRDYYVPSTHQSPDHCPTTSFEVPVNETFLSSFIYIVVGRAYYNNSSTRSTG